MRRKLIMMAPIAIVGVAVFIFIGGWIVQQLWNWLMPALFALPAVTFWQALGLLALARILFGGFGRHGCGRRGSFSPEERDRFRQRVRERFGLGQPASPPQE